MFSKKSVLQYLVIVPNLIYRRYSECQRNSSSNIVPRKELITSAPSTKIAKDHVQRNPKRHCKKSFWPPPSSSPEFSTLTSSSLGSISSSCRDGTRSTAAMVNTMSLQIDTQCFRLRRTHSAL